MDVIQAFGHRVFVFWCFVQAVFETCLAELKLALLSFVPVPNG